MARMDDWLARMAGWLAGMGGMGGWLVGMGMDEMAGKQGDDCKKKTEKK